MNIDRTNWEIINCLQDNARESFANIGRKVGLTPPAVAERVKKMEDTGVIERYTVRLSNRKAGYQLRGIIMLRAFMGKLKPFLAKVSAFDEVINCYRITGNENIIMEVVLRDQEHLEKFIELAHSFYDNHHHRLAESYLSLGRLHLELGRIELAIAYMDQGIKILEKSENRNGYIIAVYQKGLASFHTSDFQNARNMFELLLTIEPQSEDITVYKALAKYYLSSIFFKNAEYSNALSAIDYCIEFPEESIDIVDIYGLKYKILKKAGLVKQSDEILPSILERIKLLGTKNLNAHINFLNEYSQYLIDEKQYDQALFYLDKILDENHETILSGSNSQNPELKRILVQSLYQKGQAYEKRYRHNYEEENIRKAHASYVMGITALNQVKRAYQSEQDRFTNIKQLNKIYQSSIRSGFQLYQSTGIEKYKNEAFQYAESYLSNQLLEELNRNISIKQTNIPDSLLLQLENLRLQESFLTSKITVLESLSIITSDDSVKLETYRFSLTRNKNAYNSAIRYLEENFLNYYQANYADNLVSVSQVQKRLKADEALIEYFVTDSSVFAFCISSETHSFLQLDLPDEEMLSAFQQSLQPDNFSNPENVVEFAELSNSLYK